MDLRVTLEEPWAKDRTGKELPVTIRFGSTLAREVGGGGSIVVSGESVNGDDLIDAGSHIDTVPRPVKRYIPGKRIEWNLEHGNPESNGLLIPLEAVILWFGDWRFPKQADPNTPPDETYAYERNRVAFKWGYWKMPQTGPSGLSHLRRGEEGPDTTKIGPPPVPRVLIQTVDGRGQTTDRLCFRPWDWFAWEADVVHSHALGTNAPRSAVGVETFSVAQLRAMADEIESRQKTAKTPQKAA
jgi:hypothetical protein